MIGSSSPRSLISRASWVNSSGGSSGKSAANGCGSRGLGIELLAQRLSKLRHFELLNIGQRCSRPQRPCREPHQKVWGPASSSEIDCFLSPFDHAYLLTARSGLRYDELTRHWIRISCVGRPRNFTAAIELIR